MRRRAYSGKQVACSDCGARGPAEEAGDGPEPLCPGCSDPVGLVHEQDSRMPMPGDDR